MALNYEVKKKVFGFDQTKTEKYVAQLKTLGIIQFGDLCDEVTKIGMAPRGVVKMVLDGLIDTLNININKGFSVQLGDFGCFRPGINAKSQDREGQYFREMLTRASVTRASWEKTETVSGGGSAPGTGGNGEEENPLG